MAGQEGTTPEGGRLRAVLYVRISDDPEGTERGVDRQEQDCREYATVHGWDVVKVYRENDTSAFKQRTLTLPTGEKVRRVIRPKFRAMLTGLAKGEADVLIAYDLDRAVRDPRDLEDLIDAKVLHGFRVVSTTGSLRLDNDADIAMARVMVAMANKSSADTARRVSRASKQRAVEGKWHGGRPPYGYAQSKAQLMIIPPQAALLREMADRVIAGESLYTITRVLNERGERTKTGAVWREQTVRSALRNPAVKGVRLYRPLLPDGSLRTEAVAEMPGTWEPILSPETWQEVCDLLDSRRERRKITGPKRVHPFTGLIRCARCGTAMENRSKNYGCTSNFQRSVCCRAIDAKEIAAYIEEAVLTVFARIALDPNRQTVRDEQQAGVRQIGLSGLLAADRQALDRLDNDHYDGLIDKHTWMRQRTRLAERIRARQAEYEQQTRRRPLVGTVDLLTVAGEWEGRTPAWKHEAASMILEGVLIHAQPSGVAATVPKLHNETTEAHKARLREHRLRLLAQRVEFVWKA